MTNIIVASIVTVLYLVITAFWILLNIVYYNSKKFETWLNQFLNLKNAWDFGGTVILVVMAACGITASVHNGIFGILVNIGMFCLFLVIILICFAGKKIAKYLEKRM